MSSKFNSALNHHNGTIPISKSTAPPKWDYEAELVLVMGKGARHPGSQRPRLCL